MITTLLAYCGLCWSEVAGLRINDLDFAKRRIHLEHTIVLLGGRQVEDVPTTYERREVPMPVFLSTLLQEHVTRRELESVQDTAISRRRLSESTPVPSRLCRCARGTTR